MLKQGSQCRGVVKAALGVEEVLKMAFRSSRLVSVMWEVILFVLVANKVQRLYLL